MGEQRAKLRISSGTWLPIVSAQDYQRRGKLAFGQASECAPAKSGSGHDAAVANPIGKVAFEPNSVIALGHPGEPERSMRLRK